MFCCALLGVISGFAIIYLDEEERAIALICFGCLPDYLWLWLIRLSCVIVVFPDQTCLLFMLFLSDDNQAFDIETFNVFLKGYPLEAKTAPKN